MASQRDVPGVTRGIVPLLRSKGVLAFSEGANGAFTSPQVPLLFNWSDAASGSSIVYLNHPSGYGLQAEDGMGLSLTDTVTLKGFDQALIFVSAPCAPYYQAVHIVRDRCGGQAFRGDNGGPQDVQQAQANIASAQQLFPNAKIVGSTLDNFVSALYRHAYGTQALPVVTSEIGVSSRS